MPNSRVRIPTPASSTPPTGDPNTIAFFDAGGNLADDLLFSFDATNNYLGINVAVPQGTLHTVPYSTTGAVGANAHILGRISPTANIGKNAFVVGTDVGGSQTVSGDASVAIGRQNLSWGYLNFCIGQGCNAFAGSSVEANNNGNAMVLLAGQARAARSLAIGAASSSITKGYGSVGISGNPNSKFSVAIAGGTTGNTVRSFSYSSPTVTIAGGDFTAEFASLTASFTNLSGGVNNTLFSINDLAIVNLAYNLGPNTTTFDLVLPLSLDDRTGGSVHGGTEGQNAVAIGNSNAKATNSVAVGVGLVSQGISQTVVGIYNSPQGNATTDVDSDDQFQVGTGLSPGNEYNGLSLTKNGLFRLDSPVLRPKTIQSVAANDTIAITEVIAGRTRRKSYIKINSAGPVTLSIATAIDSGDEQGQSIWITNEGTQDITIPEGANTEHYTGVDFVLQAKATVQYIWTGTLWRAVGSLIY